MIKLGVVSLLVAVVVTPPDPATKAKTHGYSLSGTITAVDEAAKTFIVRNSAGKETKLVWTSATSIVGGKIKAGEKATLRYLDRDGKHIAATVSLGEPATARATPGSATPGPVR